MEAGLRGEGYVAPRAKLKLRSEGIPTKFLLFAFLNFFLNFHLVQGFNIVRHLAQTLFLKKSF